MRTDKPNEVKTTLASLKLFSVVITFIWLRFLVSRCCLLLGGKNRDGILDDLLVGEYISEYLEGFYTRRETWMLERKE
jgi:hypothetical protein